MANGFGTSPFILPNMFDKPGDALQAGINRMDREKQYQREWDYRMLKEKENDEWKKLQLIQELTDIDKYQTGEAVADALGHQKANELFTKYTALSPSLSPAELQYKIGQDIGSTTNAMRGIKDELVLADQAVKAKKALYPSLDAGSLVRDVRSDIIGRRMTGGGFANPMTVNPSAMNLDDLDFLSDYIDVNKGLKDAVVNPKNIQKDVTVLRGSPSSYVGYQGDLPFYMQDDFQTEKGFYNKKPEPTMSLKKATVPAGAFSGAQGDIEVLDKGAFESLKAESAEVDAALRKLAKSKYKDYSSMSNADKEIAMRDVAKDFITPYAKNYQYRSKSATKPPHYSINTGGSGSDQENINNRYARINKKIDDNIKKGFTATRFNSLANDEQELITQAAKNAGFDIEEGGRNIFLFKSPEGDVKVYNTTDGQPIPTKDKEIATLPFVGSNIKVQPGVAEKRTIQEMNKEDQRTKPPTPERKYRGLDAQGNPIFK